MIKEKSDKLIDAIQRETKSSLFELIFITLLCLYLLADGYHFNTGIDLLCIFAFYFGLYCFYINRFLISKYNTINHIITDIYVEDNFITFKTSDLLLFYMYHKPSIVFQAPRNSIKYIIVEDRWGKFFSKKEDYKGNSYKFLSNDQEFYILTGFFNSDISDMIDSATS